MKPVIKSMWMDNPDYSLEDYAPENSNCFGFWIEIRIGVSDKCGGDDFRILVCTPEWIRFEFSSQKAVPGRHMLIFFKYDLVEIKRSIAKIIEACDGSSWDVISNKISRFAAYEFEDYVN